jgi:3-oxoacyl-[acyl-carrier protein] reductase
VAARQARHEDVPASAVTQRARRIGRASSEPEKTIAAATPPAPFGQPQDIASLVAFLASDESAWVTGKRITASGGLR